MIVLSISSDANGVALGIALAAFVLLRARKSDWKKEVLFAFCLALPCVLYFIGYEPTPGRPPTAFPWEFNFWKYFLEEIAAVFGMPDINHAVSGFAVLASALILALTSMKKSTKAETVVLGASLFCLIACLAAISMARAHATNGTGIAKRYLEYSMLLLPLVAAGWRIGFRKSSTVVALIPVALLWLVTLAESRGHWRWYYYKNSQYGRNKTIACVHETVARKELPIRCTGYGEWDLYEDARHDITKYLPRIKALNFRYAKDLDLSYFPPEIGAGIEP